VLEKLDFSTELLNVEEKSDEVEVTNDSVLLESENLESRGNENKNSKGYKPDPEVDVLMNDYLYIKYHLKWISQNIF
jgi:hypothetical protein